MKPEVGDLVEYVFSVGDTDVICTGKVTKVTKRRAHIYDGHSVYYSILHGHILRKIEEENNE